jgi:hypothetical protein
LAWVLASRYHDNGVDHLGGGTTYLRSALRPLMEATEQSLKLDAAKRARTIVRVDAGAVDASDDQVGGLGSIPFEYERREHSPRRHEGTKSFRKL